MDHINELGQPISFPVENFTPPPRPNFNSLIGNFVRVEPISLSHLSQLYTAFAQNRDGGNWTYLPYGPFGSETEFADWAKMTCLGEDPKFYTILGPHGATGIASYMRMEPKVGCIELGHIHLSPLLQRQRAGTEALLLMIEWAFEAGYRRLEWKCDALNRPSCRAAQRLGLSYEGTFRRATIYKSRNRDTAWYAATSKEWPALRGAYQEWRSLKNFDHNGHEIQKLSALTASAKALREEVV